MDRQVVVKPHLLADFRDQEVRPSIFLPGETLGQYVSRMGIALPKGDFRVWHNGHPVPMNLWRRLIPRTGDQIDIAAVPAGGGGSKILRTVAMLALVLVAAWAGPALAGAMGFAEAGTAAALLSAGVMIGGSFLISALLPPPRPALPSSGSQESAATYTISGGRNRLRPWDPMKVIFGRRKVTPDLGAKYFTEWVEDTQYLNQIFHFGLHDTDMSLGDFKIGATPISAYQDVQIQQAGPDGVLTLFPGNVDTLDGFVLESGVQNERRTEGKVASIDIELAAHLYRINDSGKFKDVSVDLRVQYRKVGAASWTSIGLREGVEYAQGYWAFMVLDGYSSHGEIQYAYGSTDPADHYNGEPGTMLTQRGPIEGVWRWVAHPNAQGKPWRGIAPDPVVTHSSTKGITLTGGRQEPIRRTVTILGDGESAYEIRAWKVSEDIKESRESNEVAVSQIRVIQKDDADYTGQKRVAVRIKATSQLNGPVEEFSAIAVTKAPVLEDGDLVWQKTRNPAWSFLKLAMGGKINGRIVYGGGLELGQIDTGAISEWAAWCERKELHFDWELSRKLSMAEALQTIARAGRASVTYQSGRLGVIWDEAGLPVKAMFGPFNIRAGTFNVAYANSEETPDEIILRFENEELDFEPDEIRVQVPETSTHRNPVVFEMEGKTNPAEVGKEANLLAASQVWHRRRISWETDMEGWTASRGDVVQISHDLTVWDYSGRLIGRDGSIITLSQRIPTGVGTMMLRDPEGNMKVVVVTGESFETDTVTILSDMSSFALPGDEGFEGVPAQDWAFFFGPMSTPGRRFKIIDLQRASDHGVRYIAVDDDPEYYASENNPYEHTPPRDGALLGGKVLGIRATEGYYNTLTKRVPVTISWSLSASALVTVSVVVNGSARPIEQGLLMSIEVMAQRGDEISVTVTPQPVAGRGEPKSITYEVEGIASAPTQVGAVSAAVEGSQVRLRWLANPEPDIAGYEVRASDSGWGGSGALFRGDANTTIVEAGPQDVEQSWFIRAYNGERIYSEDSAVRTFTPEPVPNVAEISAAFQDTSLTNATITLSWPEVSPQFGLKGYEVNCGAKTHYVDSTSITLPADWIGSRTYGVVTIDDRGERSTGAQASIEKLLPNSPTGLRAQVIDNNVLLYWKKPEPTTLPFDHVLIKSGEDWETASVIGTLGGEFASVSELEGGKHTYWFAAVDTDGWESEPVSIVANVNEPPDFIFRGERKSEFDGTLVNAKKTPRGLVMPVDTTETFAEHFTNNGWDTPENQVDAGYPLYAQPTLLSGSYTEVFDFDVVLASSRVSVAANTITLAGAVNIATTIETSEDGSSWSVSAGALEAFATNFRYVRVTVEVEQAGNTGLARLNALNVRLSSKLKNDAGQTDAVETDTGGTLVNFGVEFLDVASIVLTPGGTQQRTAVYDFKDTIYSGAYAFSGDLEIAIPAHGLQAGQRVRVTISGRAPEVAEILSVTTDTITVDMSGAGTGVAQVYAQGMSIYLFDSSGQRASGPVSWAVRGN